MSLPTSYKLADMVDYIGAAMHTSHRALADVKGTSAVFRYNPFWVERKRYVFHCQDNVPNVVDNDYNMDGDSEGEGEGEGEGDQTDEGVLERSSANIGLGTQQTI